MSSSDPEIDEVVAAFFAAFDNRERTPTLDEVVSVFTDDASLTAVGPDGAKTCSPHEFAEPRVRMLTDGTLTDFHEWETESDTAVTGDIASRRSRYAKEGAAGYGGGGTKYIHLRRDDGRWRISSVLWQDDPA